MKYEEAQTEFIQLIESKCYEFQAWELFTDFCKLSAISLYQPFIQSEELEKEYMQTIQKYKKDIVEIFPQLLVYVVMALEDRMGDFLGECFMNLKLNSKYTGQFFTPFHVSSLMASLIGEPIKDKESLVEPCCGSGGMIIARADTISKKHGLAYQNIMEVQAVDVDILCVYMSFIQLSLLGISAEIIHGNSLSLEVFATWYTPKYIMNASSRQYTKKDKLEELIETVINSNPKEPPLKEEVPKIVTLPSDTIENKIFYSNEELEVFSTGRLF